MGCGQMAVVRQDRRCRSLGLVLICYACLMSGHAAAEPLSPTPPDKQPPMTGQERAALSEDRFLQAMWGLLHEGRAAEARQLGRIALTAHASSARLALALAYAAEQGGNCQLALSHLDRLEGSRLSLPYKRRKDMIRARCRGPWQREVTLDLTAGYRRSLVDRARLVSMRLEPGSAFHGACERLRGLCNPDAVFRLRGTRASGIDIWTQLSLGHHHSDGDSWEFAITPSLFFRRPRREGYRGDGASLRLEALRYLRAGRQLDLLAETGVSRFQQGNVAPAIAQKHRQLGIGFVMPHGPVLASRLGHRRHRVSSRWLNLHRRINDFRLVADRGGVLSGWVRLSLERSSQGRPGLMPGSRAREREAGVGLRLPRMQIGLHHLWRTERFSTALPYLAAPHSARVRRTGVTLSPDPGWGGNPKVVLLFEHRRILSPDPYRQKSTKNATLTMKYRFSAETIAASF